jgi:phenylacetate-CoA ligase
MFVGGFGFFYGARKIGSAIVPFGSGYSKRQIKLMKDFGTTMLAGIMSYGVRLAEVALKEGTDPARDLKVRKGIFGAEMWTAELKNRLSKLWNMDVYDVYGLTEAGGNGTGCDCYLHDGIHAWEDHWLWEIVDPKTGVPVEPEEEGEIVFTTLTRQAMPLIRYRTRDVSYWYDAVECDCGRTHRRHAPIKGRTDDMLKVSGVNVWPSTVEHALLKNNFVGMNYQIIVDKVGPLDRLKIIVESREKLNESEKTDLTKNLVSELRQVILQTPEVEIKDPGSLPRVEGKVKRVFDRRPK